MSIRYGGGMSTRKTTASASTRYVTTSLTPEARKALRERTVSLTSPVGRKLTLSEVLLAMDDLAASYQAELVAILLARSKEH